MSTVPGRTRSRGKDRLGDPLRPTRWRRTPSCIRQISRLLRDLHSRRRSSWRRPVAVRSWCSTSSAPRCHFPSGTNTSHLPRTSSCGRCRGRGAQAAGSAGSPRQGRESQIGAGSPRGRRGDRDRAPGAIPACGDDRHGNSRPDRDRAVRSWQRRGACLDSGPVPGPYRTRAMSLADNSHHLAHAPRGA